VGLTLWKSYNEQPRGRFRAAFLEWQRAAVAVRDRVPPLIDPHRHDAGIVLEWYRAHRPDAIVTRNDNVLGWLREAGVRVPGEVSVADLDQSVSRVPAAGVAQAYGRIGATAVDLVVTQLHLGQRGPVAAPQGVLLPPAWVDGPTVRAPAAVLPRGAPRRGRAAPR